MGPCPPPVRPAARPVRDAVPLRAPRAVPPAADVVFTAPSIADVARTVPCTPPPASCHRSVGAGPALLGRFRVPCAHRCLRLDPSLVSQIDGLCFSLCRMRIERDVLASCLEDAYCANFGRASFESASSFDGLYFGAASAVHAAVLCACAEHGRGVFVVIDPGQAHRLDWQIMLFKHSRLQFVLPPDSLGSESVVADGSRVVAVLSNFGRFKWKAKRRPERSLDIQVQPALSKRHKLRVQPVLVTRVSPTAHTRFPVAGDDRAPCGEPVAATSSASKRRPPQWNIDVIRRWAEDFPCPAVARFAIQAASTGMDSFVGDISKAVWQPATKKASVVSAKCFETLLKEIALGNAVGPLSHPPLRVAAPVPISVFRRKSMILPILRFACAVTSRKVTVNRSILCASTPS